MQHISKFGIYLNASENQVVRINSPYWIPEEPDWVMLTPGSERHLAGNPQHGPRAGVGVRC